MIHFSEKFTKQESFELPSAENFKEIKPVLSTSSNIAKEFWNKIFDNKETAADAFELSDEEIISEIYDRDENEFEFDFDANSPEIKDALLPFEKSTWEKLTELEKATAIDNLTNILSDKLSLSEKPIVEFFEDNKNNCGCYVSGENKIRINKNNFDNPNEVVDTIAHEMRHAYQYERANIGETYMDILYRYNFANYIEPVKVDKKYVNFTDYQNQLVEAEARAFAKLFKI